MATDEIRCPEQPGSPMAPVAVSSASSLDSFVSVGMPQAVLPINVISAEMSRNDRSDMISKEQSSIQEPPSVAPDCVPSGAARDCAPSGPAPDCVPSGCVVQSSDQRRTRDSIFADVPAAPEISAAMPQPMVIASDEAGQHSQNVISTNASSCSAITAAIHPGGLAIGYQSTFPALLPRVENVTMFPAEQLGNRVTSTVACTNSTPEFLYQLTKMLTDDNRDIIEWTNGTSSNREVDLGYILLR